LLCKAQCALAIGLRNTPPWPASLAFTLGSSIDRRDHTELTWPGLCDDRFNLVQSEPIELITGLRHGWRRRN